MITRDKLLNNSDIRKFNKRTWGYDFQIDKSFTKVKNYQIIDDFVIEAIERQAIPTINRNELKIPGVSGVKFTSYSTGSTEINMRVSKFANSRADALNFRNNIMATFGKMVGPRYVANKTTRLEHEVELIFPDTGKNERVYLQDVELTYIDKFGNATYIIRFVNKDGYSYEEIDKEVNDIDLIEINSVEPVAIKIKGTIVDPTKQTGVYLSSTNGGIGIPAIDELDFPVWGYDVEIDPQNQTIKIGGRDVTASEGLLHADYSGLITSTSTRIGFYNLQAVTISYTNKRL